MVPGIGKVVPLAHGSFVIHHTKKVIHWLLFLRARDKARQVQIVQRERYQILHLLHLALITEIEPLQTHYQYRWKFPDVDFFGGRLVGLAFFTIPFVLLVKNLFFTEFL